MKVIVLGGGVIGISTAYYLARSGAEVTVLDRQEGPALETSFANAGQVSPGYSTPWAAPGIPLKAMKWMFQKHAPLAVRLDGSLFQLRWMAQMLRNCSPERYAVNKERMMRVAEYSRACLQQLRADTGIQYEQRTGGTLQVFRTQAQLDAVQRDIDVLRECNVPFELLSRDQLARAEPALAQARDRLVGGLRLPKDETGDCHMFTNQLAELARGLGVDMRFEQKVDGLLAEGDRIVGVRVNGQVLKADRFVLAFGSYSRQALAPLGIDLPVYPVKGYSLTVPLVDPALAPQSTVLDETYKIAVTRFDDRIRVGGMAELGGRERPVPGRRRRPRHLLDRPAPHDARQHADRGRHALSEPVHQHGPRHARLDHGLRFRPAHRRSGHRAAARDQHRGARHRPLRRRAPSGRFVGAPAPQRNWPLR